MGVTFANLAGLWALLGVPIVIAIHFLQRESRRCVTTTFFLIERLAPVSAEGRRIERLRNSLPLWLQIAAILLLTWILIEPRWLRSNSFQSVAVVLDSSVSMEAFRPELAAALSKRLAEVGRAARHTQWTLLESDSARPTLYSGEDLAALLAAAARWSPRLGDHDPTAALRGALSLQRKNGTVIFATDHRVLLPEGVDVISVGEPIPDSGFAGLRADDEEWAALVINSGKEPQSRSWWIESAKGKSPPERIDLAPGEVRTLRGRYPDDHFELVMEGDRFSLNDRLPVVRPRPKTLLLSLPVGQALFERVAKAVPDSRIVPPATADVRLYIYDPLAPAPIPPGAIAEVRDPAPTDAYVTGRILAENHPLTAGLNWQGLLCKDTMTIPPRPGDEVLVWAGERPLIFLRGTPPKQSLVLNFHLAQSNADRMPAFVVLLNRFLESVRAAKVERESLNFETGQAMDVASAGGAGPLEIDKVAASGALRAPDRPRFFQVSQGTRVLVDGAAYFADTREADFREASRFDTLDGRIATLIQQNSRSDFLTPWFILLLVAVCLANWALTAPPARPRRESPLVSVEPEWFLLVPMLAVAAWMWPRLGLHRPLRAACLLLLVLAMVQPQIRKLGRGLDLWVLVDRSASAADPMARQLEEWDSLLERSKGADDRILHIDYADVPVVRGEGTGAYSGNLEQTRAALAIQHALAQMPPDRAARILLLSDGYATEPLAGLGERLRNQEVSLDYRLVTQPDTADVALKDFRLPTRALPGEPCLIEADIDGPDGSVPFEIRRDGELLLASTADIRGGRARLRFADQVAKPGAHRYEMRIKPAHDARLGNNAAQRWLEVVGGPRVLLVTAFPGDPVAQVLRAQGFAVEVAAPGSLHVGSLSGVKAVLINNVPAGSFPPEFLDAMDFYVREQGGGFLMAGGKQSFGSGGYFSSAVDELLPVSMELRSEMRKLAVAMAIVLDRSGSMAASVASGVRKMDLANEGTARAVELLGAQDAVSVIAVDSEPHVVVPMTGIGKDREEISDRARRITSGGGGIYIYNGLRAGWEELQKADVGQRHLVLFADAADSEQPGDYQNLIAEMQAAGATISVIGLGSDSDSDAWLLKDVALRGKGRIFFNADANTLPALFEQETVAIARSAFIDQPVKLVPTNGWLEIAAAPLEWPQTVDGYNLSYLRPEATAAVFSGDEYKAPLVAYWQRGSGRSAAVSFPLAGDYSTAIRGWRGYGDFLQTLTRWLMGGELPPGLGLRTSLDGTELKLELWFDQSWEEKLAREPARLLLAEGASGKPYPVAWQRLEPGRYEARVSLKPDEAVRGAVRVGGHSVAFGPINVATNPEWVFDRSRINELRTVAEASGGVERLDLSHIWRAPRRSAYRDTRMWWLCIFAVAFLAEVLITRIGWRPRWPAARSLGRS
jgi:hypothetical protein